MDVQRDTRPVVGLYVVQTLFSALAIVAVGLRLWARRLTKRQLVFNDWAAIAALVRRSPLAMFEISKSLRLVLMESIDL